MRLKNIDARLIGAQVRKPSWTDCSMTILDVGTKFMVGQIFSHSAKKVVSMDIFPLDDKDWELYVDAKLVIDMIPVKEDKSGRGNKSK